MIERTRAMNDMRLYLFSRLVFEMPATGGVVPSYMVRPVKLLRYVSLADYIILACEGIFVAFLLYYAVEEFLEVMLYMTKRAIN